MVWYYIFIWLLVLFGRCCTFFCLVVYCAALSDWSNKAWFYMLLCSTRSKIEVIRIKQTAFHFERLKLCLICAVVVLLVQDMKILFAAFLFLLCGGCFTRLIAWYNLIPLYDIILYGISPIYNNIILYGIILYIILYNPIMV